MIPPHFKLIYQTTMTQTSFR